MKIVYVHKSFIPSRTANSIHVMNICAALANMGHQVTLLVPDVKELRNRSDIFSFYGVQPNFEITKLFYPEYKGKTVYFSWTIMQSLRRLKPDLVLGRFINGCAIASFLGIPTVFDSHGPIWHDSRISVYLFKKMINRPSFRKMTVNSNALKKIYLDSGIFQGTSFDVNKLVVAHNGANDYDLETKAPVLVDSKRMKVGYFGHLYPGRGIDVIVELAVRNPEFDFIIAGGEEQDIAYWQEKCQADNVQFLGFIPFGDVYKYRNSCDILLAPYQGVVSPGGELADQGPYMNPIKLLEYMSSKKAIIASDLATTREVLNEKNSLLVIYNNIDDWSAALRQLKDDPAARERIAAQAYSDFKESYTWTIRAKKLIEGTI